MSCLDPGFIPDLQALASQDNPVFMKDMTEDTRERSRVLYGVLAGLLHDKGKRFLRTILDHNGYEAYRQISKDLQPKTRSRLLALLRTINHFDSFFKAVHISADTSCACSVTNHVNADISRHVVIYVRYKCCHTYM